MIFYFGLAALIGLGALRAAMTGASRERLGTAIVAISVATLALGSARGPGVWTLFAVDFAAVLLLGRLAWKAPSLWPIWVMAALGVGAAASLAFLLQPDVSGETYGRAMLLTRYAAALALLLGAGAKQASHS